MFNLKHIDVSRINRIPLISSSFSKEYINNIISQQRRYSLLGAYDGSKALGYVAFKEIPGGGNEVYVSMIVVSKKGRGRGVGRALLDEVVRLTRPSSVAAFAVRESLTFWESIGFVKTSDRPPSRRWLRRVGERNEIVDEQRLWLYVKSTRLTRDRR